MISHCGTVITQIVNQKGPHPHPRPHLELICLENILKMGNIWSNQVS
jgi:hypothetical protein